MIIRVFRCTVRSGSTPEFEDVVHNITLTRFRNAPGLVSWIAGRPLGTAGEVCVVTVRKALESLQQVAGRDSQREGVIPADALTLLEDTVLHHYEVFGSSSD